MTYFRVLHSYKNCLRGSLCSKFQEGHIGVTRVSAFRQILTLTSLPRKHSLALCLQKGTLIYASVELVKQLLPLLHIHNDW